MKPTAEQLTKILEEHLQFLRGSGGQQANLGEADLRGADLRGADLGDANLRGADLREADLRGADLRGADLRGVDLGGAHLRGASLGGADLRGANLRGSVVLQSGPLGSRHDYLVTIWVPGWPAEETMTGCWRGTLDKLSEAARATHGAGVFGQQYAAAIQFHRDMLAIHRANLESEAKP